MKRGATIFPLAPAHLACLGSFQAAIALAFIDLRLAAVPLALFLLLCFAAPFFPRFSFYLPITSRGRRDRRAVALTFDDGPDPGLTPALLDLLATHRAPATFFVTGVRAATHGDLIKKMTAMGHCIGNHSYHHSPALMLTSSGRLHDEIMRTQEILAGYGVTPLAFRPPVGVTNPRLWRALLNAGMFCLNFSCRAFDAGNRRVRGLSKKILRRVKPGSIILLHDVAPHAGFDAGRWLREIETILIGLRGGGYEILPLPELIGRPVMRAAHDATAASPGPAASFYNGIACAYDSERSGPRASKVALKEQALIESNFLPLISGAHRVLEIGSGTGLYTLKIARRCGEVTAVDPSESMAAVLKEKAAREGLTGISCVCGDIETVALDGTYDAVCAFSSFEYVPDLAALFKKLARHIRPDGVLYFTTARRSPFRFFVQIGNAMRQGIWLHARSGRSIRKSLAGAGFGNIRISSHVLATQVTGGMLMEAMAYKTGIGA